MKKIIVLFLLAIAIRPASLQAQITNLTVETYYVSDATDALDSSNIYTEPTYAMPSLPVGSKTYRVYLELAPGCRLKKIYGDATHALKIVSTENFFNSIERGQRFGKDIDNIKLKKNTTAIDSWLTLGKATKNHEGILKAHDPNGTILHPGNDGGTAGIAELLLNNDATAGIPLTLQDGLIHDSLAVDTVPANIWVDEGFTDTISSVVTDTTVFGDKVVGSEFVSYGASLQLNTGILPPTTSDNNVLVAQLTTHGEITLELNVVLLEPSLSGPQEVRYVANFAPGESNSATLKLSPFLKYPQVCGCTDPHYLEYSNTYPCSDPGACHTAIVFGCMDPLACNFKPDANFSIPALCCYPGRCNDRDLAVVCPVLTTRRAHLYPNPVKDMAVLEIVSPIGEQTTYGVYNTFGQLMFEQNISVPKGTSTVNIDVSALNKGVYLLRFYGEQTTNRMFLKD